MTDPAAIAEVGEWSAADVNLGRFIEEAREHPAAPDIPDSQSLSAELSTEGLVVTLTPATTGDIDAWHGFLDGAIGGVTSVRWEQSSDDDRLVFTVFPTRV
ncbi:hypothetical protein GQS65_18530 [Halomarina oriensis]|uniref:Uncharacterized protein n=1 Tax=Halomarina oriensis TaxID=671145 RepID=A0A6B0GNF1_9EURY|nr:hypothetical protein [Halomarina oriensis]